MNITKRDVMYYMAFMFIAVSIQMAGCSMINISTYEKTVGIGQWVRVAGWSEAIVDFIKALEAQK